MLGRAAPRAGQSPAPVAITEGAPDTKTAIKTMGYEISLTALARPAAGIICIEPVQGGTGEQPLGGPASPSKPRRIFVHSSTDLVAARRQIVERNRLGADIASGRPQGMGH